MSVLIRLEEKDEKQVLLSKALHQVLATSNNTFIK